MHVVSDELIQEAEQVLFQKTGVFDDERKSFIREWNTCDLQAVPGSGKTTVLMAKLIVLEKLLSPAKPGGILVLSHTNAAVDEIKKKIGKHCPRLFSEPHFIGTIQSFVDRFLAIPYYIHKFKKKPIRIDDEIYNEQHNPGPMLKGWLDRRHDKDKVLYDSRLLDENTLGYAFDSSEFPLKSTDPSDSYKELLKIKKDCLSRGFLCFEDAYILANEYLQKISAIRTIIQKRFKYVFVDEMQDMEKHQCDILEELFGAAGCPCVFQRIGDTNQAIYSGGTNLQDFWKTRGTPLRLEGSHRLHPHVATIVERLALSPIPIKGLNQHPSGTPINIKPHLLVYKDKTIENVIPEYARLIQKFRDKGEIPSHIPQTYKAICWTAKKSDDKIRIQSFFPAYDNDKSKPKIAYAGLESHLYLHDNTFNSIRKSILNAFLYILRKSDIEQQNGRAFSKKDLLSFLKNNHPVFYTDLKLKLYKWSCLVLTNEHVKSLAEIKAFIPLLLQLWNKKSLKAISFISQTYIPVVSASMVITKAKNCCHFNEISIDVSTVHAVKGQTHTSTLYMESYLKQSYESKRLANVLKGKALPVKANSITKQSMKMAYVGFSRPTHLLCFAVHEDRFNIDLKGLSTNDWEIINVP